MTTEQTPTTTTPIACDPSAIPAELREQWVETGKYLYAAAQDAQELPDGYAFQFPTNSAMLLKIAEYVANERLCCPFLHFTIEIEPSNGPFWLRLTGGAEVKAYIRSVFAMNPLLTERVAKAAGLQ